MVNEKESLCYSGGAVRAFYLPAFRDKGEKGNEISMKIRFIAAVLAAFFMLPVLSVAAHGDDEYCPADDAPVLAAYTEPRQEELPQEPPPQEEQPGIVDITPRTEAPSGTVTVTDNIAPEDTGTYSPAEDIPAQELPAREPGGTSNPFTPSGTGTVADNATDGDGKEFFTITTPDENVFYLVIDRQRTGENVYLLNAVTEADLLSLAKMPAQSAPVVTEPTPTPAEPGPEPEPPAPEKSGGNMGMLVMVVVIVIGGGGVGWYFKIYRPKQQGADGGEDFDGEDYGEDESDPYGGDQDAEADYDGADWDAGDMPDGCRLSDEDGGEDE